MWPETPFELICLSASSRACAPRPGARQFRGRSSPGVSVCFARGGSGSGRAGERGWAGAALMRADRHLAGTAVVRASGGAPTGRDCWRCARAACSRRQFGRCPGQPEVVVANATGHDHPHGAGLALRLGAVLDLPSIGVTDQPLLAVGAEPGPERGAVSPLLLEGAEVARLLRTRVGVRPLIVHPAGARTSMRRYRWCSPRSGGRARRNLCGGRGGRRAGRGKRRKAALGDPPAAQLAALLPLPRDHRDAGAGGARVPRPARSRPTTASGCMAGGSAPERSCSDTCCSATATPATSATASSTRPC